MDVLRAPRIPQIKQNVSLHSNVIIGALLVAQRNAHHVHPIGKGHLYVVVPRDTKMMVMMPPALVVRCRTLSLNSMMN